MADRPEGEGVADYGARSPTDRHSANDVADLLLKLIAEIYEGRTAGSDDEHARFNRRAA